MLRSAMSGIDGALHDVKARALGVPVYDLLGGKVRDRVPVYANGWMPGTEDPREIGDAAKAVRDKGFKGLKFDPFFPSYLHRDAAGRCAYTGAIQGDGSFELAGLPLNFHTTAMRRSSK